MLLPELFHCSKKQKNPPVMADGFLLFMEIIVRMLF
jgi:hypothetical protein